MTRWPEGVPHLSDGTVTLRAHRSDDLPAIVEMCRDPLSVRWAANLPHPYELTDAVSFLSEQVAPGWHAGTARGWAIEAPDSSGSRRFAGNIDIRGGPDATIGFVLHPWARGQGVMSRGVRLALRWSFAEAGIELVTWMSRVGNAPSRRVAWAAGFTLHATMPRVLRSSGRAEAAWVATVLPTDDLRPKTRWLTPAVLRGERVLLRPHTEADIPRIVQACSDARTRQWLSTLPSPYTAESARSYLDALAAAASMGGTVAWCIADPDRDRLLANISIFDLDGDNVASGEIGYWTHPDARGRGVMTEAVRLLVAHALSPLSDGGLGLRRLQLLAGAGNAASAYIARATGFLEVGRERQAELLGDGSYDDLLTFDILAGPLEPRSQATSS